MQASVHDRSRNKCPIIPVGSCSFWNSTILHPGEKKSWIWNNSCPPKGYEYKARKEVIVPSSSPKARRFDEITHNQTSFVFFGSSHIRELYKEFIRLHNGQNFNAALPREVKRVMNGKRTKACDPLGNGYKDGLYGVDLAACGPPGKRMVPELGERVAIGFKTFLHTPIADELFLEWLANNTLMYPQVIVTDVGVWGPRGTKMAGALNYTLTVEEEIDFNLKWLRASFPTAVIIFIAEHQFYDVGIEPLVNPLLIDFVKNDERSVILRKDSIMELLPPGMKCDHACSGPVLVVIAHLILDWLEEVTSGSAGNCTDQRYSHELQS